MGTVRTPEVGEPQIRSKKCVPLCYAAASAAVAAVAAAVTVSDAAAAMQTPQRSGRCAVEAWPDTTPYSCKYVAAAAATAAAAAAATGARSRSASKR